MSTPSLHQCELTYTAPYDWEGMLAFFRSHHLPYIEATDDSGYLRVILMRNRLGWFRVEHNPGNRALRLSVWNGTKEDVAEIATSVRRMFDLDADPAVIFEAMQKDKFLSTVWAQYPGLRVARSWNAYESVFSTVL